VRARTLAALIVVAAVAGAGIGAGLALSRNRAAPAPAAVPAPRGEVTWASRELAAPDFRLRDEAGRPTTLRSHRGRVVLLTFLDSRCTQECPIQGRLIANVQRRLGPGSPVDLLVVTVDPWADTGQAARRFAAKARWTGRWQWLLGTPRQVSPVWASYHIGVRRTPTDIAHTAALFLIDAGGFERAVYPVPFEPADVAAAVRDLASS
jgi:protein SCO1/2